MRYSFWFSREWLQAPSQSASQSVSRSASPPGSQSVSRSVPVSRSVVRRSASPPVNQSVGASVGTPACRSVSQSGGRSVGPFGPCAKCQAVSQSHSPSVGPPVFEIYLRDRHRQNEGACLRDRMDLRYVMNRYCQVGGGGVEFLMNRYYQTRGGVFKICGEPEPPHEGACLKNVVNRNRQMRVWLACPMNRNPQTRGHV